MARKTIAQLEHALEEANCNTQHAFNRGIDKGKRDEQASFSQQKEAIRLQQQMAAAKLIEEIGRMASRVGYMLDKVNSR